MKNLMLWFFIYINIPKLERDDLWLFIQMSILFSREKFDSEMFILLMIKHAIWAPIIILQNG